MKYERSLNETKNTESALVIPITIVLEQHLSFHLYSPDLLIVFNANSIKLILSLSVAFY
jgi:hypothetical protein